jgi:hypothetical protein
MADSGEAFAGAAAGDTGCVAGPFAAAVDEAVRWQETEESTEASTTAAAVQHAADGRWIRRTMVL